MRKLPGMLSLLVSILLLAPFACVTKQTPPPPGWDRVAEAAKKEGKVNIYMVNVPFPARTELAKAFGEKYGITVEVVNPSPPDLEPRIASEQRAKAYTADVVETDAGTAIQLLRLSGFLAGPIKVPEAMPPRDWIHDPLSVDPEGYVFVYHNSTPGPLINTDLIKPEDEPKSYWDLLKPQWRGKILWDDPSIFGPGSLLFAHLRLVHGSDEFFHKLAMQDVRISRHRGELHAMVARGESPILLGPSTSKLMKHIKVGAPVKLLKMKEGVPPAGWSVMLVKNAPHPNAGKLFVNWFLSKEGQTIFSKAGEVPSFRKDVSQEWVQPYYQLTPEYPAANMTREFVDFWTESLKLAADIFELGK